MNILDLREPGERTLGRCLRRQAEAIPEHDYIVWGERRYGYAQVNQLANGTARAFADLGVKMGDPVCIMMDACPDWVWLTAGLNKLGAIWIPTNTDYKGRWLRECLEDAAARILIVDAALLPRIAELGALPFERILVRGETPDGIALPAPSEPLLPLIEPRESEPADPGLFYGDTAAILWTSGTTGRAKGVMQSHNAWLRGAIDGMQTSHVGPGDVLYNCLPLYQSAAWVANIYRALVAGVPCAMDARFSASEFWARTRAYGATHVFTLGAMHIFLWNAPEREDDRDNPVRVAQMVPFPAEIEQAFMARFGIEEISQGYGQSEVMGLLQRRPGSRHKPNALGTPHDGITLALLDDADREVGVGEVGEFCVRPSEPFAIFNGYWQAPAATLRAFRNLWYHTGDLGRRDGDGEYFFVDRKADYIRYKGRNVSSFAVESVIAGHGDVLQCAAHGVPSDELTSESELKACVVLKPGAETTAAEIARFVNDNAPYFFVPRYIEFLDTLPSTPTGRVQKFVLRDRGVTPGTWDARSAGFEVRR